MTSDGTLAHVVDGAVASRLAVGVPARSTGALDSAVDDGRTSTQREIWVASDEGPRVVRVDPGTHAVTATVPVAPRPGGLAADRFAVWAFHFLQGTVTRIDVVTAAATQFEVPGARATGIALGENNTVWLLTTQPAQVLELDQATGAVKRTFALRPPFPRRRVLIDTWSLDTGGAVWAALPNHGAVARIDPATGEVRYIRVPYGNPFGVDAAGWVATDRAVVKLDPTTGALEAARLIPAADRTGFVSIVFGYGRAWLTNYDRDTLMRLRAPNAP